MIEKVSINERSLIILKEVIERYIRDGQPVGSKLLAEESCMSLSPATIRHIMSDLEEAGYLHSPHTSAGRIPTRQGYRLFVDCLLKIQPFDESAIKKLRQQLNPDNEPNALVEAASSLLSQLTNLAGVVTLPKRESLTLRHVEFLPLSDRRVLTILVLNDREVQNRIIYTNRNYSRQELQEAGNYLTQMYAGKEFLQIHQELVNAVQNDQDHMRSLMPLVREMADKVVAQQQADDYVLAGETNLLAMIQDGDFSQLRSLFDALTQKRDILHLLDACLNSQGVQIFIGRETGYEVLDNCSVVTAPYFSEGKIVGVLGVIGPTRMAYDRVVSTVDITSKLLSAALDHF